MCVCVCASSRGSVRHLSIRSRTCHQLDLFRLLRVYASGRCTRHLFPFFFFSSYVSFFPPRARTHLLHVRTRTQQSRAQGEIFIRSHSREFFGLQRVVPPLFPTLGEKLTRWNINSRRPQTRIGDATFVSMFSKKFSTIFQLDSFQRTKLLPSQS